jgi:hypothetical protein
MRTFRRKLVITPLLIAMALVALGLPASAQEVYQQNGSQTCCAAQSACAVQAAASPDGAVGLACCPDGQRIDTAGECSPAPADGCDQSRCGQQSCAQTQSCCPGARSILECDL